MPSLPLDPAGEIPSEAWEQVQDAAELCEALESQGRAVRFRRDSPHPWAELESCDGGMTVMLRPRDLVDTRRMKRIVGAS